MGKPINIMQGNKKQKCQIQRHATMNKVHINCSFTETPHTPCDKYIQHACSDNDQILHRGCEMYSWKSLDIIILCSFKKRQMHIR